MVRFGTALKRNPTFDTDLKEFNQTGQIIDHSAFLAQSNSFATTAQPPRAGIGTLPKSLAVTLNSQQKLTEQLQQSPTFNALDPMVFNNSYTNVEFVGNSPAKDNTNPQHPIFELDEQNDKTYFNGLKDNILEK